tara:strand:+ start:293 stop:505 length:213 start_codon:yes stop_codon:yes gene_type:complete
MSETETIKMGDTDWTPVRYSALDENDLFWLETRMDDFNSPMRKIDETSCFHLRDGRAQQIDRNRMVYLKD